MCVVECRHYQVIWVENYFFRIGFLEPNLLPTKRPPHRWLLYLRTVFLNELSQLHLLLQLEYLQRLGNCQLSVSLFSTLGDLKTNSVRNSVQEGVEVIQRTVLLQLEHTPIVTYIIYLTYLPQWHHSTAKHKKYTCPWDHWTAEFLFFRKTPHFYAPTVRTANE